MAIIVIAVIVIVIVTLSVIIFIVIQAVNVNLSDMVVILSAKAGATHEDPTMADKEAILATLNTNAMTFNKVRKDNIVHNP